MRWPVWPKPKRAARWELTFRGQIKKNNSLSSSKAFHLDMEECRAGGVPSRGITMLCWHPVLPSWRRHSKLDFVCMCVSGLNTPAAFLFLTARIVRTKNSFFELVVGHKCFQTECKYHTGWNQPYYLSDQGRFSRTFARSTNPSTSHDGCAERRPQQQAHYLCPKRCWTKQVYYKNKTFKRRSDLNISNLNIWHSFNWCAHCM